MTGATRTSLATNTASSWWPSAYGASDLDHATGVVLARHVLDVLDHSPEKVRSRKVATIGSGTQPR